MKLDVIYNVDCLDGMKNIKDKSIDMILCDLPYGVTGFKWDIIIPFKNLWEQYKRIIKDNGAIVLFSTQPFTTKLIHSNLKDFRYCWYWKKNNVTGGPFAKVQPMICIEDICVFYKNKPLYNPQGLIKLNEPIENKKVNSSVYGMFKVKPQKRQYTNYPKHLLEFKNESSSNRNRLHPTQKPIELCKYLIKTYTNENQIVLDNCMGSGTTAIACIETNRRYIGFELDKKYYDVAINRINDHVRLNRNGKEYGRSSSVS